MKNVNTLPHRTIYSDKRNVVPHHLLDVNAAWLLINQGFRHTAKPRINRPTPLYPLASVIHNYNAQIVPLAARYDIPAFELPLQPIKQEIIAFRKQLQQLKERARQDLSQQYHDYKVDNIYKFLNQRCEDYIDNQSKMINSILKQTPDKIVIDKLECNGELITDAADIKHYTNIHFQTIASIQPNDTLTSFIPDE